MQGIAINNDFQKYLKESNHKPNKIWVDKGSEFYNRSVNSWLEKHDIEMYSMHNKGKKKKNNKQKKIKNNFISDLKGEENIGTFYEKQLQKINQKEFRVEKVIKREGDKLHLKWKGYDSSFNS